MQALQEALGDLGSDLSYALGGWSGRFKRRAGKLADGKQRKMEAKHCGHKGSHPIRQSDTEAPTMGYIKSGRSRGKRER